MVPYNFKFNFYLGQTKSSDLSAVVQVHYYGSGTISFFKQAVASLSGYEKPIIMGEFGRFDDSSVAEAALVLHNGIWSALHLKSGGHFWWWDYIHDHNLYDEFIPLSANFPYSIIFPCSATPLSL